MAAIASDPKTGNRNNPQDPADTRLNPPPANAGPDVPDATSKTGAKGGSNPKNQKPASNGNGQPEGKQANGNQPAAGSKEPSGNGNKLSAGQPGQTGVPPSTDAQSGLMGISSSASQTPGQTLMPSKTADAQASGNKQSAAAKPDGKGQSDKIPETSAHEQHNPPSKADEKEVVFELHEKHAHDIRLLGCFTNWDKSPIALRKVNSNRWQTRVRLGPGSYHYRFLVDGEWRDDPAATKRSPNPYGTFDSVVEVS